MGKTVIEEIRKFKGVRIPKTLSIKEYADEVRLILDSTRVQKENMQLPGNAFEGWAFAVYSCVENKKIALYLDSRLDFTEYEREGHLCRFLYRIIKFNEQYEWFRLSDDLADEADKFKKYLLSGKFTNNIGSGEAGRKEAHDEENAAEEWLSCKKELKRILSDVLDIGDNPVNRQLPVGLFKDSVSEKNRIFTGGKSAIDLWTWHGNELDVVELKTKNKMIGIITEIFFYANYMYDLVADDGLFTINMDITGKKDFLRGYECLLSNSFNRVNGIMLADKGQYHPWVNEDILIIMNKNGIVRIRYYMGEYPYSDIPK